MQKTPTSSGNLDATLHVNTVDVAWIKTNEPLIADPIALASEPREQLSPAQSKAMEMLASGHTIAIAAESAGVARSTIYRWLKGDAAFVAAFNAWQQDMLDTARGRLLALTDTAVTAVAKSMEKGDAKTALVLLKHLGALRRATPGPTDPADVQRQQNLALRIQG